MKTPRFWAERGPLARALSPLGAIAARITARRLTRPGADCGVPVICIGNAGVGGAGKTILVRHILAHYADARPFALTRGHGGALRGPVLVDPTRHTAREVGDEALLLAATAPTILARNRAAGARLAVRHGASVIVMDDGLQNPGLVKTVSFLTIDGGAGFGNGFLLPAGPLREPIAAAAARCAAAVLIGSDSHDASEQLPHDLPVLGARLIPLPPPGLAARPLVAFAGIGRPEKFFETLRDAEATLAAAIPFADHHAYKPRDLVRLADLAARHGAALATTEKDAVKLPEAFRRICLVVPVRLAFDDPEALVRLLP